MPAGEAFVFGDFAEDGSSRSTQPAEKPYADAAWRRQMYGPKQNSDAMAMPCQQLHSFRVGPSGNFSTPRTQECLPLPIPAPRLGLKVRLSCTFNNLQAVT